MAAMMGLACLVVMGTTVDPALCAPPAGQPANPLRKGGWRRMP